MKLFLMLFAILNFWFVLAMTFGPHWFAYVATFTAIILFVYDISSKKPLRLVGAIFNFMGIVVGGIAGVTPLMYMAVFGSILLFVDHISSFSFKKSSPDT